MQLTEKDRKELKYQCRMGYILPPMLFVFGTFIALALYESIVNSSLYELNLKIGTGIAFGVLILSIWVSYLMNNKYYSDLRNNEKVSKVKTIQWKTQKKDFVAGSGNATTLPHNNAMKEFIRYNLIVENTKYRVDKTLYNQCSDGDKVLFFYAPKSMYLLGIEIKSKTI